MIKVSVDKQRISILSAPPVVSGTESYDVSFMFDDSWDEYVKTAVFLYCDHANTNFTTNSALIGENNMCQIPVEALRSDGYLRIAVLGVNGDSILPTVYSRALKVKKGAKPEEPYGQEERSLYRQIMRLVADINAKAGDLDDLHTITKESLVSAINEINDKVVFEKVEPFVYTASFPNIQYDAGYEYYKQFKPLIGACSVVRKGNYVGRMYDWTYDNKCSFICKTPSTKGRHAVIGMATAPSAVTEAMIDAQMDSPFYDVIPFMLLDGINDSGLMCEINVTTGEKGITRGTNEAGEDLFAAMIPRYVLDYASTVDEAVQLLQNRNIFCAYSDDLKEEFHFMISDKDKSVVIEFVDNVMVVIDTFVDGKPIMTNFYLDGYNGTRESLTPYAMGIERYAILSDGYDAVYNVDTMRDLMLKVKYTKAYSTEENPTWYSEFAGNWPTFGNLTKDSPPEAYVPILMYVRDLFAHRERDGATWHTVHEAVYDIRNKTVLLIPQEGEHEYVFELALPFSIEGNDRPIPHASETEIGGVMIGSGLDIDNDGVLSVTVAGDKEFIFNQYNASATWEIQHYLDKYPSVTVVDSAGTEVLGNVEYVNRDSIVVSFNAPFSGVAYLN